LQYLYLMSISICNTEKKYGNSIIILIATVFISLGLTAQKTVKNTAVTRFTKHILTTRFVSEGVAIADIDNDGRTDIIAGAYWFKAPLWQPHEIAEPAQYNPLTEFSNSFLNFTLDVNQDGWTDVIRIGLPGEEAVWYENPASKTGYWKMHTILLNAGNESPAFADIDRDGREDLLCNDPVAKQMIWMKSPAVKGDTTWQKFVIAAGDNAPGTDRYTHGLGYADMNADGLKDVIITKGWWQCPANPTQPNWAFHKADFGADCSQIYTLSRNNKAPDIISASAHNYGIWWHERVNADTGKNNWKHHTIFDTFSESHALSLADINGDGEPDLVTGKRYFAHNEKDPGALEPAVLYWFEYKPGKRPQWIPHLVDDNSGVGLQAVVKDINKDGRNDIIIANKKGVFFFEQQK
jgi:hypothetical protein